MDKFYSVAGKFVYTGVLKPGDHVATPEEIAEYENPVSRNTYSKLKIVRALKSSGVWDSVKEAIESAGVWDEWLVAQELSSNDALFVSMLSVLETAFPALDTDSILDGCKI